MSEKTKPKPGQADEPQGVSVDADQVINSLAATIANQQIRIAQLEALVGALQAAER